MANDLGFKVPEELVKPIIKDLVATYIAQQMGDANKVIAELVSKALSVKVNENGVVDKYDSYNHQSYINLILNKSIHELAKETLKEILDANKEKIKEQIKLAISKQGDLGEFIFNGFKESLESNWHSHISVAFKRKE